MTHEFKLAQVIVSEGKRDAFLSETVAYATDSWWTHTFIVTGPDEAVEAWFPQVRTIKLSERLAQLDFEGRAWVVLDYPGITDEQRIRVADSAQDWVGRPYDVLQVLLFLFLRRFRNDGVGAVMCARLISGLFYRHGMDLFPRTVILSKAGPMYTRLNQLEKGWATPIDIARHSCLEVVFPEGGTT